MKKKLFIYIFLLIFSTGCKENYNMINHKIKELSNDNNLLKCEFGKSIERSDFNRYINFKYIYQIDEDIDGDGNIDEVLVKVDSSFFSTNAFSEESNIPAVLIVNDQFVTFTIKCYADQGLNADKNYYACNVSVVDINNKDSFKEIRIELGQSGEDPPSLIYFARYTNEILTLTRLYSDTNGVYGNDQINLKSNNLIEVNYIKSFQMGDDVNVEVRKYSKEIELYSAGFKMNSIDSSEVKHSIMAACPYVYIFVNNEYQYKGEIIRNIIGKEFEDRQSLELGSFKRGTHTIRIWEKKDEVSYLNEIQFIADEKLLKYQLDDKNKNLIELDDVKYFIMKKGEFIDIKIILENDINNLSLIAKGYYIPYKNKNV